MSEEEILFDFANNGASQYVYDSQGYEYEIIDKCINKVLEKNKVMKQKLSKEATVLELIYELLDEYDINIWKDISYVELADFWVNLIEETSKEKLDTISLENKRKSLLQEYLFGDKEEFVVLQEHHIVVDEVHEWKNPK